ncbi:MAG: tetratricopeptide repeat protein [Acidobacteriota bacterium]|nr:tetratricopeptide repeat protein [Acidobacteriota bacterium]
MRRLVVLVILSAFAADAPSREERLWQYRNLGKAFYENPTTQVQAVAEFRKALDLAPDSVRERLNYGIALLRAGKTADGIAELEKVQKLDPKLPHTWFNLGIVYRKDGDFEKAIPQFERMIQLTPDEPVPHYNLGVLYKQTGKLDAAQQQFEAAVKLNPDLAAPHFQLYNVYRQQEKKEQAGEQLAAFQRLKKAQEGAAIAEDMEWCDYAEIYDPIDMKAGARPPDAVMKTENRNTSFVPDGLLTLDLDGAGKSDLLAWNKREIRIWRGGLKTAENTGLAGITGVISVSQGDFDNDGLPDLCILTEKTPLLYRNRKGRFEPFKADLPAGRFEKAVWLDYDHDYDLDLFLLGEKSVLMRNQGAAGFADHTKDFPFAPGHALDATPYRLMKDSKSFDLLISYADHGGVLYRDKLGGSFAAEPLTDLPANTRGLAARDSKHDGWLDIQAAGLTLINAGGHLSKAQNDAAPKVETDFDQDGNLDTAEVADGSLLLTMYRTIPKQHWIRVQLLGIKNVKLAYGAEVEVKTGTLYQKKVYDAVPLTFELGSHTEADTVRITWPNGLIQNEIHQPADKAYQYKEAQRLSGSCPMIWSWDGSGFRFITDVLGIAPLGASSGDGQYFPVDHDEYIQIPHDALKAVNGRYEVRITEELSEVSYLDQVQLFAVDHPRELDIYTSEKWKGPPFPEFRLYGVNRRIYPKSAHDGKGRDVRAVLLATDRKYPETFRHDQSGVAELHTLDLDFGRDAASGNKAVMIAHGWVDWADGSTFLSTAQEGKGGLIPPYLQVKDWAGKWKTVIEDMGMPDGKPKTIAVDLTGKFLSESREVRIVTNLCVYWDEIFLGEDTGAPRARMTPVPANLADLRFRGFSASRIFPARNQPEEFFYAASSAISAWNPTPGLYTRYGDVRELVEKTDDRFVIMGSGDELRLTFEAAALPALPTGWQRDFILKVDGWAKDRDANTAYSQSVEPLPFHAMSSYPYPAREHFPDDAAHEAWRKQYNTRPALRLIRPLNEPLRAQRAHNSSF